MAKYLDTSQISSELMQLLKEAKEKIILVTYSLQVNNQIQERLKTKSKVGSISEITIIYGNTKLKEQELKWMEEIEELKVYQKKNLHAKCYINENKAIISSMNLYDYSQTSNIEMGFLIERDKDKEAYEMMMEDIYDLKINGDKKKLNELEEKEIPIDKNDIDPIKNQEKNNIELTYVQQVQKFLLEEFRKDLSHQFRQKSETILSDNDILNIITSSNISESSLVNILRNRKKADQLSSQIISIMEYSHNFTIGEILDTQYQNDQFSYDQIQMKTLSENLTRWYDTKQELPQKGEIVAVSLNKNWFNDYIILEESNTGIEDTTRTILDYSNSVYRSTKELSEITSLSSREINSILMENKLMEKEGNDWYATKKGNKYGAMQKEGRYGKFILWPEEIIELFSLTT
ncbi:phospholipase D-like domain-containing protein [Gramella sp. GC03-9]|uniref:Phospholipase D-like domain-containing protein n=1 Tax=Christiangramia oceanisediminis TaxID=2920386 RepID=A0A9X2RB14_9FLAO|nr:phospholipase D-like domain-containing protein [Gramella oceanisediminis]MCP9200814.1 phospholipase D-like domain-containing protein [Gramella oceanisediminis]